MPIGFRKAHLDPVHLVGEPEGVDGHERVVNAVGVRVVQNAANGMLGKKRQKIQLRM